MTHPDIAAGRGHRRPGRGPRRGGQGGHSSAPRLLTEAELVAWGKEQMAGYKAPPDRPVRRRTARDLDRKIPQARAEWDRDAGASLDHANGSGSAPGSCASSSRAWLATLCSTSTS